MHDDSLFQTSIHLTGSVASKTTCGFSDYDFGLEGKLLKEHEDLLAEAFGPEMKSIEYKIVKKLHLMEIHMHNGVKIDVVGYCNTVALQHVLAQLELDQRMTIVCLKALFKKLRKAVVLELLWFVPTRIKNIHGWKNPFFAQLCHYFGDFDFDKEQMTTKGRIKKRGRCAKVTIWDMFSKRWNSGAGFA